LVDVIVRGMEVVQGLDRNLGKDDYGFEIMKSNLKDLKSVVKDKKKEIEK